MRKRKNGIHDRRFIGYASCFAIVFLTACGPRVDRFVVHGGAPGSEGTDLPIPAPRTNLVLAADVTPFKSTPGAASVVLQRTAPDTLELPVLTLPLISANSSGFLNPTTNHYEWVIPADQVDTLSGATVPLAYPSIWTATFSLPYQALPSSGTLNKVFTFQVEAPSNSVAFDHDTSWGFSGFYKYLPAEGNNQQPRSSNRTSRDTAYWTSEENYPIVFPNTGAIKVDMHLNTECHGEPDKCVGPNDQWYGYFGGPLPPLESGRVVTSLEVMIKGSLTLVQIGAPTGPSGGIEWGPAAHATVEENGWKRYRGNFADSITGVGRGNIRIQGAGTSPGSVVIDMISWPEP